jgi:phage major head subunit gpT-like protein
MASQYPGISSRAIIGEFYKRLAADLGASWIPLVSMLFNSDQESETYKWLGQVPQMREWIGGRQAKGFTENGITIKNKKYESTLDIEVDDLRRDKTGQINVRIAEQARRANAHWASLLSTFITNGAAAVCYDGQYFFDTDHSEGDSGLQSNSLSVDISALPTQVHGSVSVPSIEEMQLSILQAIQAILGFKDDQGEPMNEDTRSFLVMTPVSLWQIALAATALPNIAANVNNVIAVTNFRIEVVPNARLSSWTDAFVVFRTDSEVKPFIRQEEVPISISAKAEGSEYEFDFDKHQYGIKAVRNVGYGYWQTACKVTMV